MSLSPVTISRFRVSPVRVAMSSENSREPPKGEECAVTVEQEVQCTCEPIVVVDDDGEVVKDNKVSNNNKSISATSSTATLDSVNSTTTLYHRDSSDSVNNSPTLKAGATPPQKEYKGVKRYAGILFALSSSFLFSLVLLFVKILRDYDFNAYGASFWRYVGTAVPCIPLLFYYEWGYRCGGKKKMSVFHHIWPPQEDGKWKVGIGLLFRGIVGTTAVILRYYSLQFLTMGDTSVITNSTPVVVTVLAHFILGERCAIFPVFIVFTTLIGVVIVAKPPILTGQTDFDTDTLIGTALACGSLLCQSFIVILTRQIREIHFAVVTFVTGFVGVVQTLILIYSLEDFDLPIGLMDSLLVAGVAGLSFLAQICMVLALKFENAGPVSIVRSSDVLFGFVLQYIFLSVAPDLYSAIGAVIVLIGVLSIGFRKWLGTLPPDDKRRKTWFFVLK